MPDTPDLSRVDTDRLNAFLSATLRPGARRWYVREMQHGSWWGIDNTLRTFPDAVAEAARVPGREPFQCIATPRYASTADGAEAVIGAMGERRFFCSRYYDPLLSIAAEKHECRFVVLSGTPGSPRARGFAHAATDARAVALAAVDALYPTASAEARALLA